MTEAQFQAKLIRGWKAEGYMVVKIIQANLSGLPDIMLLRDGKVRFVEVKAASGRVSPVQQHRHEELRAMGFSVEVVYP